MRNTSRLISSTCAVLAIAGLAACAPMSPPVSDANYPATYPNASYPNPSYPAANYPANQQNRYVEYGRVSNVEVFRTQEPARGSGVGAVLGGVAGAVVGHQIGGGTGKDIATVAGAVGGAMAGNAIEKNRNATVRETYRVSVQLDNGTGRAYDVPSTGDLRIGDRVRIENGLLYRM
ncbi:MULTISPECIES: glycine zipper 2TM domain-containing protein [unclassified Polaromonas]|jgi:outer membrane lipoprotein SlyB|uniref:glycine zipper 2TM domain-containing protein n=1 Tax=unclassified Polaromonas TaxID=2638319 RepID=UPI000F097C82|nr:MULTISPECIES: glycine zipper 2TM domain-containing protein [unclassified Polaromonas]AYQ29069.1 glycine zipper 2TM domain-containing protein [Polaromonas sp. SP1]MCZ8255755.1 glycine zipper 2TM domain-containing protein [Polaromonas sp.]MCZ8285886.1 glycine zipper 2TM domain-containing protein [Bacteroidia bacterium]QGJ19813.1 glycine zipper 2TM domain-containing protein [Polaromonas sp. Pch-P]